MASSAPKVGLLLRLWNQFPELVGSSVIALIGVGLGTAGIWLYQEKNGDVRKYKYKYTVYRPDDPRAATIRKHSQLDD